MAAAATVSFERATVTIPELVGDEVVKTARAPLATMEQADRARAQLERYHMAVAAGPLAMAELIRTSAVRTPTGIYVQHVTKYIPGEPLSRLPYQERRAGIGKLAQTVMEMPTLPGSATRVLTPIDGRDRNFVAGKLVDGTPPWEWGSDGWVYSDLHPNLNMAWRVRNTDVHGCRNGILTELMLGAAPDAESGEPAVDYWHRVRNTAADWYGDLLPDMPAAQQEDFAMRIDLRLAQHLGKAIHDAANQAPMPTA